MFPSESNGGFSHGEQVTIQLVAFSFSILSFLGSSVILASYAISPQLRKLSFMLVFWMSVADVGANLAFILTTPGVVYADCKLCCQVQGFMLTFFHLSSVMWTTVISQTLYLTVIRRRTILRTSSSYWQRQLMTYHAVCWGLPLAAATAAVCLGIGNTGGVCWIKAEGKELSDPGSAGRFFLFYVPVWIMIAVNACVYVGVIHELRMLSHGGRGSVLTNDDYNQQLLTLTQKLKYYPIILVFCWIWGTVNRLQNFFQPSHPDLWLFLVQVSAQQLQGFLNSLAYGATPAVQRVWQEKLFGKQAIEDTPKGGDYTPPAYVNKDTSEEGESATPQAQGGGVLSGSELYR